MICQIDEINNHLPEDINDHSYSVERLHACQHILLEIKQSLEEHVKERAECERRLVKLAADGEGSLLVPVPPSRASPQVDGCCVEGKISGARNQTRSSGILFGL